MMFMDDEEELELLRQYEENNPNASDRESQASDEIDSDLEDKIMSLVHYQTGVVDSAPPPSKPAPETVSIPEPYVRIKDLSKEKAFEKSAPKVVYAPIDVNGTGVSNYSANAELQLDEPNSDVEMYEVDSSEGSEEEGEIRSSEEEGLTSDLSVQSSPEEDIADEELDKGNNIEETMHVAPKVTRVIDMDEDPLVEDEKVTVTEREVNLGVKDLIEEQARSNFLRMYDRGPCHSCWQRGHYATNCPNCRRCGGPKHGRCAGADYCYKCKQRGHFQEDCVNPKENEPCKRCKAFDHQTNYCPSIYIVYKGKGQPQTQFRPYCFFCGRKGHYGDDCPSKSSKPNFYPYRQSNNANDFSRNSRYQSQHRRFKESDYDDGSQSSVYSDSGSSLASKRRKNKKRRRQEDDNTPESRADYRNDRVEKRNKANDSALDAFFVPSQRSNYNTRRSGNMNWRAINEMNMLPQPTRSGTVDFNQQTTGFETDFPRSNPSLPKPTSSGVIDLTGMDGTSSSSSQRKPKYHGGYKRR
ncbi:hypothetical protein BDF20DRAFT_876851 [Mycotypha africana]|uniref:uncharacterized protein n=1 Tax=Mycotypha africana TaxID=64632 RepID=UPI002301F881|nr:uncharacterized protein BDF20DRAFT_876851 [Mycotypha africana]KAI8975091.1 hypothetical protein BDF20DRAFT_876851 [Mycotypha africana]